MLKLRLRLSVTVILSSSRSVGLISLQPNFWKNTIFTADVIEKILKHFLLLDSVNLIQWPSGAALIIRKFFNFLKK
jgi:hypothetical protein